MENTGRSGNEYGRFECALRKILSVPKETGKEKQAKPKPKKTKKKRSA
jgi:hypothetical protein